MSSDSLLKLDNINRYFYTHEMETRALCDVSLQVTQGEYVSMTGPSGCGKSTLLAILGLLDKPSTGRYWLSGVDTENLSQSQLAAIRNQKIGFVFQSFNLISDLSVYENVELPLTYRAGFSRAASKQKVDAALERVGMSHRKNHFPAQLSGGQQQRAAIARALIGEPELLLADEPTGNLDEDNAASVMSLLSELHQSGSTICMVTHDPALAGLATRQIRLADGKLVASE